MPNSIRFGRAGANSGLSRTTNLPPITGFTMMAWVKYNTFVTTGGGTGVMSYGAGPGGNYYVIFTPLNAGTLTLYNGSATVTGQTLVAGLWYHIALTVSGTTGTNTFAYVNGVLDISIASRSVSGVSMWYGTDADGDSSDSCLGALKVYDRVLSASEIAVEMTQASPVNRAGLNTANPVPSGWERLTSGLVTPQSALTRWVDVSGNAREWTETGTIDTDLGPPIRFRGGYGAYPRQTFFATPTGGGGGGGVFGSYFERFVGAM